MKIGILTFHRSFNYGAFMQCYSMCQKLLQQFPNETIEVVDYTSQKAINGYEDSINKASKSNQILLRERNEAFVQCQETLPLSPEKIVSDDMSLISAYLNDNYDIIIVGSDAVWNWKVRGFPNVYFLKDFRGLKLSYAASAHGLIYQQMTEQQKDYLSEAFSDFQYIGVRDVTTENMVRYANPTLTPMHNCDPTMFLDLKTVPCDMNQLKAKMESFGVDFNKPLVGIMAGNTIGYEIKKHFGHEVQLVSLYTPNQYSDVYLHNLTPFEWAHVFSLFKVTITHFFHGTMLSLVNKVPVVPIEQIGGFSAVNITKIQDLMSRLSLPEWRYSFDATSNNILKKALLKCNVHLENKKWKEINQHIELLLCNDFSSSIQNKLEQEKKSANSFFNTLKNIVKERDINLIANNNESSLDS